MPRANPGSEPPYRKVARESLARAQALFESSEAHDLRYACLELRLSIEAVCYGLLLAYRPELSAGSIRTWQPDKVMRELVRIDPEVGYSRTITIERANKSPITFQDIRFDAKWAHKSWQTLGNFLHVPTISQMEAKAESEGGDEDRAPSMRTRCSEILEQLTKVLSSTGWNFRFGNFHKFLCDCGFEIQRRRKTVISERQIDCVNCGRVYDVESGGGNMFKVELRKLCWTCPCCDGTNELAAHELKEGVHLRCLNCKEAYKVESSWKLEPTKGAAGDRTDENTRASTSTEALAPDETSNKTKQSSG